MWGEFWLAVIVGLIFLYAPAYAGLRIFGFSRISSAASAPVVSLLAYSLLAVAFSKIGVWTNGWVLFISFCIITVLAVAIRVLVVEGNRKKANQKSNGNRAWLHGSWRADFGLISLYLIIGVAVGSYVFLGSIGTADSTSYAYDDYSHLAYVRSFIERGNFSSLSANYEYDLGGSDRYYPAAWHLLAASLISICQIPLYVGANAALFLCCSTIYPLSCLFLIRKVFGNDPGMQVVGAFLTLAFASFPWEFIYYGRLTSNLLAFCFVPMMLGCTMFVFGFGERRATRIRFAIILVASFALSLFTQPSVCFTWVVFATPYLLHIIWNAKASNGCVYSTRRKIMHVGIFCMLVVVFLVICYMLPFLYSVTRFKWRAPMSPGMALGLALTQSYPSEGFAPAPASPLLAVLVFVGIFFAARKPKTRWIILLWVILLLMYVVSAGTNLKLKNYMTGWWYTDSHRVLAMYAIVSYCLAVIGLSSAAKRAFRKVHGRRNILIAQGATSLAVLAIILIPNFEISGHAVETQIGSLKERIAIVYDVHSPDEALYSEAEREFVERASEITGEAKVFNIPKDGSLFAYASSGMKTLLRWDLSELSSDSSTRIVQRSLDDYASDQSVRNAVDDLGFEYVLLLDKDHEPPFSAWGGLSYRSWMGPTSIDEDTPGFELVLSEGDMALYRVVPSEELSELGKLAE